MKVLFILYSDLLKEGKDVLYSRLESNLRLVNRVIGLDNVYASVSSQFKDLFDRFPDLCFINNLRDSAAFGAYKGLRKLRGNDVLLVEGLAAVRKEHLLSFFNRVHVTVGMIRNRWSGLALVKMREIDYVIRSLERNFDSGILNAFRTLKETYGIATDFLQLKGDSDKPILGLK